MLGDGLAEIFHSIVAQDAAVYATFVVVLITTALIYFLRPFGHNWKDARHKEKTDSSTKEEEDDDYLREVARCALRLANHTPQVEDYPDYMVPVTSVGQDSMMSPFPMLDLDLAATSEDGDSMLVNLPEDLEEEHEELELLDLTADDISVKQDEETDSDLSPQDMAEIAEELNTSMMSIDSLDADTENTESTSLIAEPSEAAILCQKKASEITDLLEQAVITDVTDNAPSSAWEDRVISEEHATLLDQQGPLDSSDEKTNSNDDDIEEIPVVSSDQTDTSTVTHTFHYVPSPRAQPKRPGQQKYENLSSQLTNKEKELEIRARQEQLVKIRELMQSSPGMFGELSDEDLTSQFRLYCM